MLVTLTMSNFSTRYHYSSNMVNGISRPQKLGKQNHQKPGNNNGTLNKTSTYLNCHDKSVETLMLQLKNHKLHIKIPAKKYLLKI